MNVQQIRRADEADLTVRLEEIDEELQRLTRHDEPTRVQAARAMELSVEHDECTRAMKIHRLRTVAQDPANLMSGSQPDGYAAERHNTDRYLPARDRALWGAIRESGGAFAMADSELRSRAISIVEGSDITDASKERTTAALESSDRMLSEYVAVAANPHYRTAFRKLLRDPQFGHSEFDADELDAFRAARAYQRSDRAMYESNTGAVLVPFSLDPAINLTNVGTLGDTVRSLARVDLKATPLHHVVTSAGVTAEWTAEAAEAADASPTALQPTIPLYKADAYIQISMEFLQDTEIESDIQGLMADAKARLEAQAHILGNGTSQPRGVITALLAATASQVASTTNGAFVAADVFNLIGSLPARYHRGAAFMGHPKIGYAIRQMAVGAGMTTGSFWSDFAGDNPSTLVGRQWAEASEMQGTISSATASNDALLVCADFRQFYRIVDHPGAVMIYEPLVKGANRRPTGEVGWYVAWRTGGDVVNADGARLLVV